jgi:hypothetical protein
MSRVRVEKFHDNFYLQIDGQPKQFNRESSDLLTSPILAVERSGIFSCSPLVVFSDGVRKIAIDFQYSFNSEKTDANPLVEILRRVRLVQETFAKAEAEKEVWEGVVGDLPLVTEEPLFDVLHISWSHNPPKVFKVVEKSIPHSKVMHWVGGTMLNNFVIVPTGRFEEGDNY